MIRKGRGNGGNRKYRCLRRIASGKDFALNRISSEMDYRYHRIGKYWVCLDQSIFDALRTLSFGYTIYRLGSLGISKSTARHAIKVVAKSKIQRTNSNHYLSLPVFGHFAVQVHRGYKVFDFSRSEVTKVFNTEVTTQEAEEEIAACKKASAVSSAPRYLMADPKSTWFKEEYIRGTHATDVVSMQSSDFPCLYPDIERCLIELINCQPPSVIDTLVHIDRLASETYRGRWLEAGVQLDDVDRFTTYLDRLRKWLRANSDSGQLQLVLTHGDFSLVNAISTEGGLRFIDWEGIGPGSLFSDIFNFLFTERYYGRTSSHFTTEVISVIERYRASVLSRFPELSDAASLKPKFARRLYYLERLRLLIDRDVTKNLRGVVCKSISMFNDFDNDVGDIPL